MLVGAGVVMAALVSVRAQESVDHDVFWRIRQEGTTHSQILRTLHVLTDVHGPRLTGSPNLKAAGDWALEQLAAWGLRNGEAGSAEGRTTRRSTSGRRPRPARSRPSPRRDK